MYPHTVSPAVRFSSIFVIAVLVVAAARALPTMAGDGIPNVLTTQLPSIDKTYPTWVSAAAAVRPDGSLDPGLFHPVLWERLHNLLVEPRDPVRGCFPAGEVFRSWVAPPDISSLEATFRSSERVLRGRVVDREFGFDRGIPGQLLKVEVLETLKGSNDLSAYFFFVPVGTFQAGKIKICKSDYRFPTVPVVGDEVVLLILQVAVGDPFLDLRFEHGLIVLRGDLSRTGLHRAVARSLRSAGQTEGAEGICP
jgi:hypothetical protein